MGIDLKDLSPEQRRFLEGVDSTRELVDRSVALLSEICAEVNAQWLTDDCGRVQLELRTSDGSIFGYGAVDAEAALSAFQTCWREVRYIPSLPPASAHESDLLRAGRTIDALKAYVRRNGVALRDAREKLRA